MATVTLTLRGDPMLMNELVRLAKAGRMGKAKGIAHVISNEIEQWRKVAEQMTRLAMRRGQAALTPPVRVTCTHLRRNEQAIDTAAIALAEKAAVDGVVAAGLLPDDRDTLVVETRFPAHRVVGYEGIELVIDEVPADAQGALL